MECCLNKYVKKVKTRFVEIMCPLSCLGLVYAGLLVFFVPSVICEEWPPRLTYDSIFNNTNFPQIQHISPYKPVTYNSFSHSHKSQAKGNEVDDLYEDKGLLVGFARDPFRYSVPIDDYKKGVRSINPQTYKTENRGKRGVFHLYNMLQCANGCDPLTYKGYGCYCGFLGSGRPTDGIDRCCQLHDRCYEDIYCPVYTVYFQPYYWKCYHGEPLCALENYHTQDQVVNGCAGRLCECDRCYEDIFCPVYTVYFQPYYWKCYHGEPLCALKNYQTQDQVVNGCAGRLCECDRQFAMCVKRYSCPRGRPLCKSSPLRLLQNILMFR